MISFVPFIMAPVTYRLRSSMSFRRISDNLIQPSRAGCRRNVMECMHIQARLAGNGEDRPDGLDLSKHRSGPRGRSGLQTANSLLALLRVHI